MTANEILKTDTSKKSLNELVNMLDGEILAAPELFGEEVYKLRVRKEEETGIPMEEDAFGRQEAELKRSLGISFDDEEVRGSTPLISTTPG